MPYRNSNNPIGGIIACITLIVFLLMIGFLSIIYMETKEAIKTVQEKIDHVPVTIPKYDSTTQTRLDTIELHRQISHRHVDNLYNNELQDYLDSLYNAR